MTKNANYTIDHINAVIVLSKSFHKAASVLNTPEYKALLQLRRDNPTYAIQLREIRKSPAKRVYGKLTFRSMEEYIVLREGKDSSILADFRRVKEIAKIQAGPYAYVKKWFLERYKDEFVAETEEEAA